MITNNTFACVKTAKVQLLCFFTFSCWKMNQMISFWREFLRTAVTEYVRGVNETVLLHVMAFGKKCRSFLWQKQQVIKVGCAGVYSQTRNEKQTTFRKST